jgi:hypothetical protein
MRFLFLSWSVAVSVLVAAASGRAAADTEALLAKAIKAHGGEEALAKYKALRLKLKRTEQATRFAYNHEWLFGAPDKFKDVGDGYYLGRRIVTTYATDGQVTWSRVLGKTEKLEGKFAEWYKDQAHLMQVMRLVPLKQKEYELKAVGEIKVEGKTAAGLLVRANGQKDLTLFFDAESGLLAKVERMVYDNESEKEVIEERFYGDYSQKDGPPYARKVIVKQAGKTVESHDVREVKFLEKADDREFRRQ